MYHPQTNTNAHITPYYRGLTDEQCRLIHCASLEILERTGVQVYYQPAIELLKKAGCYVEENRVRIPAHRVEWALRTAPSRIMMYDRSGKPVMPLGDRISTFGTGSDCLNILDHRRDERRKALLQDVVDGIRVADAMPHIDFIMSMFLPSDASVAADVRQMEGKSSRCLRRLPVVQSSCGSSLPQSFISIRRPRSGITKKRCVNSYTQPRNVSR
jgi:trimethylamine--corrinoid protein Co-methyltransferase